MKDASTYKIILLHDFITYSLHHKFLQLSPLPVSSNTLYSCYSTDRKSYASSRLN